MYLMAQGVDALIKLLMRFEMLKLLVIEIVSGLDDGLSCFLNIVVVLRDSFLSNLSCINIFVVVDLDLELVSHCPDIVKAHVFASNIISCSWR